jgi:hypothetical protein
MGVGLNRLPAKKSLPVAAKDQVPAFANSGGWKLASADRFRGNTLVDPVGPAEPAKAEGFSFVRHTTEIVGQLAGE